MTGFGILPANRYRQKKGFDIRQRQQPHTIVDQWNFQDDGDGGFHGGSKDRDELIAAG